MGAVLSMTVWDLGIAVHCYVIVGFPTEKEEALETIELRRAEYEAAWNRMVSPVSPASSTWKKP